MKKFIFFGFLVFCFFVSPSHAATDMVAVNLGWDANNESDLAGYYLYYKDDSTGDYNGVEAKEGSSPINIEDPAKTTFSVSLPKDKRWFFTLTAYDEAGLESGYSNEVTGYYYALDPDPAKTACSAEGMINYDDGTIVITSLLTPPDPKSIFWRKGGLTVTKGQQVTVLFSASAYGAIGDYPVSILLVDGDGIPISKERVAFLTEKSELHEKTLAADETAANVSLFVYCGHRSAIYNFYEIEVTAGEERKTVMNLYLKSQEP